MIAIAKLICTLISIVLGIAVFLSGLSYQIYAHAEGSLLDVWSSTHSLFGHEFSIWHFDPAGAFRYAMDNGFAGFSGFAMQALAMLALGALVLAVFQLVSARILRLFANRKTDIHGSARWATDRELKAHGLLKGRGVVLGQTARAEYLSVKSRRPKRRKGETRAAYRDRLDKWVPGQKNTEFIRPGRIVSQNGNAHTLIVGSTRSGKGVSCIIPTEFCWNESMIVLDPKGEGWDISANYRSLFSWTFRFQPERPDESIHYNPLLSIRRGKQAIPDIQNLAYILIPQNTGAKDPFWDNEARKLFAAAVGYVVFCEEPKRKTFAQVYSIFSNSEALQNLPQKTADGRDIDPQMSAVKKYLNFYASKAREYIETGAAPPELRERWLKRDTLDRKERAEVEEKMHKYLSDDDRNALRRIQQDLEYFASCEDKQLSSVVSTMLSQLQVIADPNVQAVTDRSDFTMDDFMQGVPDETGQRRPVSMYMIVSLSSMERLIPLINIFYSQAITLLARDLDAKRPFRLLLIFDEFRQLGKLDIVEKALSLTAGYGILCMIAIQSFDQLRVLYQSEAMFIDNFAYQVVLRVNDEQTSQKIERILGQQTVQHRRTSVSGKRDTLAHESENVSWELVGRPLMTSEEIRTMGDNDCIIIQSGEHPYKGKKIRYYLDKRFRKLYVGPDGKNLPSPKVEDNLPHHTGPLDDGYNGVDGEGWLEMLGVDSYELTREKKGKDEAEAKKEAAEARRNSGPDPRNAISADEKVRTEGKQAASENREEAPYSDFSQSEEDAAAQRIRLASDEVILTLGGITDPDLFEEYMTDFVRNSYAEDADAIIAEIHRRRGI